MPRPLNKPGRMLLLEAINLVNVEQFTLSDITFGAPTTTTLFGKNTLVMANSVNGGRFCGSQPIYYDRLDIEELFARSCTGRARIDVLQPTPIEMIVAELNNKYELMLMQEDIANDFAEIYDPVDGPLQITMSMGSYTYYGDFKIYFEDTLINIETAIYDPLLDGLNYIQLPNSPNPGPGPGPGPGPDPTPLWNVLSSIVYVQPAISTNAFVAAAGWYFNSTNALSVEFDRDPVPSGVNMTEAGFNQAMAISDEWIIHLDTGTREAKRFNRTSGQVVNGVPTFTPVTIPAHLLDLDWLAVYGQGGQGGDWIIFDGFNNATSKAVVVGWNHVTNDLVLFRSGPTYVPADKIEVKHEVVAHIDGDDIHFAYFDQHEPYTGNNPDIDYLQLIGTFPNYRGTYHLGDENWLICSGTSVKGDVWSRSGGSLTADVINSEAIETYRDAVLYLGDQGDIRVLYYDHAQAALQNAYVSSYGPLDLQNVWLVKDGLAIQYNGSNDIQFVSREDLEGEVTTVTVDDVWTIMSAAPNFLRKDEYLIHNQVLVYTKTEAGDPMVYAHDGSAEYEVGLRSELQVTDVNTKLYIDIHNFEGFVVG